jgi:hypothetical protein
VMLQILHLVSRTFSVRLVFEASTLGTTCNLRSIHQTLQ